ncbi:MAG: ATP-binding protein [Nitrospira sp. SB0678_bin_10]|nr:ATP-binding protein [Nitrospira sp. SB0678_bin_10]
MIEVLSKPADQINLDDINALIASKVPEGEQIEFKENLPARGQTPDPWENGGGQIGDRAKDKILEEVVAFANAHGGALVLGIKESDTKPPVATKISPIPRCRELAERLKLVFRDCVEPQLSRLELLPVPTEGESGVIIIRVGRSRLAPHRVTKTLVCPVRRSDRCEEMTMREIQDMTLNVSRGLEGLEKRLLERSKRFEKEFDCLKTPNDAFGIRLTATPVGEEIRLDRVFWNGSLTEEFRKPQILVFRKHENGDTDQLSGLEHIHGLSPAIWRPRLRATRSEDGDDSGNGLIRNTYQELHCDGLIEWGFVSVSSFYPPRNFHPPSDKPFLCNLRNDLPVVMFANLAFWANHIRKQALAPAAEYALEVELRVLRGVIQITRDSGPAGHLSLGTLQPGSIKFPRYSLDDPDEIPSLLALFERDFWNSLDKDLSTAQGTLEIQKASNPN